MPKQEVT